MSIKILQSILNSFCFKTLIAFFALTLVAFGQRNGDDLAFQGFTDPHELGIKAIALGGAFNASSGELSSVFYNPAGLTGIKKFTISVSVANYNEFWRDNEEWYPGGNYLFLNDYMERLFIPPASFNNIWIDSLAGPGGPMNPEDFKTPVMGVDPYSKAAADHQQDENKLELNNIALAVPFKFLKENFVAAAAFVGNYNGLDYDWNGDYLDPNWGTSTLLTYVPDDSILRSNWDAYTRNRTDGTKALFGGLSWKLNKLLQFGAGFNYIFGKTNDELLLNRVGYFRFVQGGDNWSFSYDDYLYRITGTSDFSGFQFNVGGLLTTKRFNIGIDIKLPYTLTREWNYDYLEETNTSYNTYSQSGIDKVEMPALYAIGFSYCPVKYLTISLDYQNTHYGAAKFNMSSPAEDTSANLPVWGNSNQYSLGLQLKVSKVLMLMGGYKAVTVAFIPYGVAIRDEGFPENDYSFGFSYKILWGTIDAAYQYKQLKYYDVYANSRNYTLVSSSNFYLGYTIQL